MNFDILLPIKPYYAYLIMKGEKTVEVRKFHITDSRWSGKMKVYVSKDKKSFRRIPEKYRTEFEKNIGKVAFKFVSESIAKYECSSEHFRCLADNSGACLTYDEIMNYCNGKDLYGYNITDLKIYDEPKELGEFYRCSDGKCQSYNCKSKYCGIVIECGNLEQLTRPPQNYIKIKEVLNE